MEIFRNKKPNFKKLLAYGFKKKTNNYIYQTKIMDGEFELTICISSNGSVKTSLLELESKELYTLHLVKGADGKFVGRVIDEYNQILNSVCTECFENNYFKSKYTLKVMDYIETKYGDKPEYLWEKFPNNAVYRKKDTRKWYAAILTVKKDRFGFDSEVEVEVIDLHAKIEDVPNLIKEPNIYPGYHMNKKHWITLILDGSCDLELIFNLINKSYLLAKK